MVVPSLRRNLKIDQWVVISEQTSMTFSEFQDLDEYIIQAIYNAVVDRVEAQNKNQQKTIDNITNQINSTKDQNVLAKIEKPSFLFD